jgi:hypothetical protein
VLFVLLPFDCPSAGLLLVVCLSEKKGWPPYSFTCIQLLRPKQPLLSLDYILLFLLYYLHIICSYCITYSCCSLPIGVVALVPLPASLLQIRARGLALHCRPVWGIVHDPYPTILPFITTYLHRSNCTGRFHFFRPSSFAAYASLDAAPRTTHARLALFHMVPLCYLF